MDGQMDGRTDRQTDRQTDGRSFFTRKRNWDASIITVIGDRNRVFRHGKKKKKAKVKKRKEKKREKNRGAVKEDHYSRSFRTTFHIRQFQQLLYFMLRFATFFFEGLPP